MDNNPLVCVMLSKLRASHIHWLSKLPLFDFNIKYQTSKSNPAADTLSHHPKSVNNSSSDDKSERYEGILYVMVCNDLSETIESNKLLLKIKQEIQISIQQQQKPAENKIEAQSDMVDVLATVSPQMTKLAQEEDIDIGEVMCYVRVGKKPTLAQIRNMKSKPVWKYLQQFDWLFSIKVYYMEC